MDIVGKLFSMLIILLGIFIAYKYTMGANRHTQIPLKGFTISRLHSIRQIIRELLEDEREGLALAVIYKGEIVVDLWGGYADKSSNRQWERDTLTCAYSSSKIFGGLMAAKMVTEGTLRYDEKLGRYYYSRYNEDHFQKENFQSGLIAFDREFSIQEATQPSIISRIIEESKPLWKPGSKIGYHAITYGFLIDQLFRRADNKHRSIAEILEEDVKLHSKGALPMTINMLASFN
uniref:Beta-lactamase domain-containing protein n=1 Tax=Ascaris lumbricoides TaxID=6252 RepID=A0A0M3HRN1_ASCLU